MKKLGYRGYISSRPMDDGFVPQRVQNLVIRDYVTRLGKVYALSATEYSFKNSFMMLMALCDESASLDGIVLYSTHLLPSQRSQRERLYEVVRKGSCEVHFALEELALKNEADITLLEELLFTREITQSPVEALIQEAVKNDPHRVR